MKKIFVIVLILLSLTPTTLLLCSAFADEMVKIPAGEYFPSHPYKDPKLASNETIALIIGGAIIASAVIIAVAIMSKKKE